MTTHIPITVYEEIKGEDLKQMNDLYEGKFINNLDRSNFAKEIINNTYKWDFIKWFEGVPYTAIVINKGDN